MADSRVYSFHHPLGCCIFLDQDKLPPIKVSMFVNHKSQCSTSQDETIAQQRCEQTDSSLRTSLPLLPYGFPMVLCLALISKHTAGLKDTQWQGHHSFWKCPDWLSSLLLLFLVGHIEAQTLARRTCWSDIHYFLVPFGNCPSHQRGIISCITLLLFKELWNILFLLGLLFLSVESMSIWHWMTL